MDIYLVSRLNGIYVVVTNPRSTIFLETRMTGARQGESLSAMVPLSNKLSISVSKISFFFVVLVYMDAQQLGYRELTSPHVHHKGSLLFLGKRFHHILGVNY